MKILQYRKFEKKTLQGFFELELPSGLCIRDLTLHKKDGASWVGYPSKPYEDNEGNTQYQNIIWFMDKDIHYQFQKRVLSALDDYFAKQGEPVQAEQHQKKEEILF
jgi:hypothetical protein